MPGKRRTPLRMADVRVGSRQSHLRIRGLTHASHGLATCGFGCYCVRKLVREPSTVHRLCRLETCNCGCTYRGGAISLPRSGSYQFKVVTLTVVPHSFPILAICSICCLAVRKTGLHNEGLTRPHALLWACWLRLFPELFAGTFGMRLVSFIFWFNLAGGRSVSSDRSPYPPLMVGYSTKCLWNLDVVTTCALHLPKYWYLRRGFYGRTTRVR